jgi:phage antirepressor YoqD-like protein
MNQIYTFNGSPVTFANGENLMVNATEMAKAFDKRPSKWLELPSTIQFIESLEAVRKSDRSSFIKTENGVGTWMHEDVAMEFARWLSPAFAIWCNDRIKELMKFGATFSPETLRRIVSNPESSLELIGGITRALLDERVEKERLQYVNSLQSNELRQQAPKVAYCDAVLNSEGLISTTELANEFRFRTAQQFNAHLKKSGIIRKVNDNWALTAKLSGHGLAKYKTFWFTGKDGKERTRSHLYWTEQGRKYLHEIIKLSSL